MPENKQPLFNGSESARLSRSSFDTTVEDISSLRAEAAAWVLTPRKSLA
jgi:hypothetical protein